MAANSPQLLDFEYEASGAYSRRSNDGLVIVGGLAAFVMTLTSILLLV